MTTNEKFSSCVVKTTGHYYKLMLIWGCAITVICAVVYGLIIASSTLFPMLVQGAMSVPTWIYIPVGLIVVPPLAAIVVCYVKRNEKEIAKADEAFVCKE
jgi:uncharacterized membrane protein